MQKNTFLFGSLGFDGDFESLICLLGCFGPLQILFGVRASWLLVQGTASPDRKKTWKGQDRDLEISFMYLNREREREKGREREWNVNVSLLSLRKYFFRKTYEHTHTHNYPSKTCPTKPGKALIETTTITQCKWLNYTERASLLDGFLCSLIVAQELSPAKIDNHFCFYASVVAFMTCSLNFTRHRLVHLNQLHTSFSRKVWETNYCSPYASLSFSHLRKFKYNFTCQNAPWDRQVPDVKRPLIRSFNSIVFCVLFVTRAKDGWGPAE